MAPGADPVDPSMFCSVESDLSGRQVYERKRGINARKGMRKGRSAGVVGGCSGVCARQGRRASNQVHKKRPLVASTATAEGTLYVEEVEMTLSPA